MDDIAAPEITAAVAGEVAKGATNALVKAFIEKLVTPYFSGKKTKVKLVNATRKYARNIEFRTRCVPTIAIQGGSFVLEEVYEPLRLLKLGTEQSFRIDGYPSRLFSDSRCVAIVDAAGMGKSTLTKYIIRRCLSDLKKIPLLVELRRLKQGQTIVQFICDELLGKDQAQGVVDDLVASLMDGNYIFLLDGYDEVDRELRIEVSDEISRISCEYQYCNFWLTSRPDPALSSFSEFSSFEIANLSKEQACSLLTRYDKGRGLARQLIEKLDALPQVEDFLGNPLLVTLLYKAFDYKAIIPIKRNIFFRQVFDALYQDHDLSKEGAFERRKKSNLDIDDFHKVLRSLGFFSLKAGKVQYSQVEFTNLIQESINRSRVLADVGKLRSDLLSAVPIFVRDGDEIRWSHKAFQDYFASQFIYYDAGPARDDLVARLFSSDAVGRYENILSLLAEVDLELIRERCILPFLGGLGLLSLKNSQDSDVAAVFLEGIIEVYVLTGLSFKRKAGASAWIATVMEALIAERPEAADSHDLRFTYSVSDGVALVGLLRPDILKYQAAASIDQETFPWARGKSFHLAAVGAISESNICNLNELLKERAEVEDLRYVAEVVAHMVDINLPTIKSLEALKIYADQRRSARSVEALLDGI